MTMTKSKHRRNIKWILSAGVLILFFFLIQTNGAQTASATNGQGASNHEKAQTQDHTLSHEQIITLTDQFMETLVQQTKDNNKVVNYHTKEELLAAFDKISTKEVALTYVDFYYHEDVDGLYIIPTETPPWFNKENDYDMVQLDNNKVKVEQEN